MIIYPYASSDRRNEIDTGMSFKLTEKYQIGVPGVGIQIQNAFLLCTYMQFTWLKFGQCGATSSPNTRLGVTVVSNCISMFE